MCPSFPFLPLSPAAWGKPRPLGARQGPLLAQPISTFQSSGYPTGSGRHVTQSRQSGSQDSCLECWVRNVLFGIRLLVATKAVGTGCNEEKQPEDKANTEPRGLQRKVAGALTSGLFCPRSLFLSCYGLGLFYCMWNTLTASPDFCGKRQLYL